MSATTFVKHYASPSRAESARAHHDWLRRLNAPVRIPQLHEVACTRMVLEHLEGRQPVPADLPVVAAALGDLHTAAYTRHLHAGQLDQPFEATTALRLVDFVSPRSTVLPEDFAFAELPCALYKDSNIRNFILIDNQVAIIDFDDLTLAPFGYDLAKLVVSAAMTHGPLTLDLIENTLNRYNTQTIGTANAHCDIRRLQLYTEIHHRLTSRYLGRHGYTYDWPTVRPRGW
ncbi:phosphotransferase [Nocardia sp. NPDC057272]|uniref:phosphotransferase n=1 Tax=Nocardia sp. NPDC057272 TaxID=3346079 RepID=UPI003633A32B